MNTADPLTSDQLSHPRTTRAFRAVQRLLVGYLGLSLVTLALVVVLRNHSDDVDSAVWTRAIAVVATALLLCAVSARAARGSRGAYRRLRIISIVTVVAIALIIVLPGTFPVWMKVDQGLCGLIMLGVAVVTNSSHLRELFASR
jgi:cytochrome bd-type quinol oxidase subunit 2